MPLSLEQIKAVVGSLLLDENVTAILNKAKSADGNSRSDGAVLFITGDQGSGKTTALDLIYTELTSEVLPDKSSFARDRLFVTALCGPKRPNETNAYLKLFNKLIDTLYLLDRELYATLFEELKLLINKSNFLLSVIPELDKLKLQVGSFIKVSPVRQYSNLMLVDVLVKFFHIFVKHYPVSVTVMMDDVDKADEVTRDFFSKLVVSPPSNCVLICSSHTGQYFLDASITSTTTTTTTALSHNHTYMLEIPHLSDENSLAMISDFFPDFSKDIQLKLLDLLEEKISGLTPIALTYALKLIAAYGYDELSKVDFKAVRKLFLDMRMPVKEPALDELEPTAERHALCLLALLGPTTSLEGFKKLRQEVNQNSPSPQKKSTDSIIDGMLGIGASVIDDTLSLNFNSIRYYLTCCEQLANYPEYKEQKAIVVGLQRSKLLPIMALMFNQAEIAFHAGDVSVARAYLLRFKDLIPDSLEEIESQSRQLVFDALLMLADCEVMLCPIQLMQDHPASDEVYKMIVTLSETCKDTRMIALAYAMQLRHHAKAKNVPYALKAGMTVYDLLYRERTQRPINSVCELSSIKMADYKYDTLVSTKTEIHVLFDLMLVSFLAEQYDLVRRYAIESHLLISNQGGDTKKYQMATLAALALIANFDAEREMQQAFYDGLDLRDTAYFELRQAGKKFAQDAWNYLDDQDQVEKEQALSMLTAFGLNFTHSHSSTAQTVSEACEAMSDKGGADKFKLILAKGNALLAMMVAGYHPIKLFECAEKLIAECEKYQVMLPVNIFRAIKDFALVCKGGETLPELVEPRHDDFNRFFVNYAHLSLYVYEKRFAEARELCTRIRRDSSLQSIRVGYIIYFDFLVLEFLVLIREIAKKPDLMRDLTVKKRLADTIKAFSTYQDDEKGFPDNYRFQYQLMIAELLMHAPELVPSSVSTDSDQDHLDLSQNFIDEAVSSVKARENHFYQRLLRDSQAILSEKKARRDHVLSEGNELLLPVGSVVSDEFFDRFFDQFFDLFLFRTNTNDSVESQTELSKSLLEKIRDHVNAAMVAIFNPHDLSEPVVMVNDDSTAVEAIVGQKVDHVSNRQYWCLSTLKRCQSTGATVQSRDSSFVQQTRYLHVLAMPISVKSQVRAILYIHRTSTQNISADSLREILQLAYASCVFHAHSDALTAQARANNALGVLVHDVRNYTSITLQYMEELNELVQRALSVQGNQDESVTVSPDERRELVKANNQAQGANKQFLKFLKAILSYIRSDPKRSVVSSEDEFNLPKIVSSLPHDLMAESQKHNVKVILGDLDRNVPNYQSEEIGSLLQTILINLVRNAIIHCHHETGHGQVIITCNQQLLGKCYQVRLEIINSVPVGFDPSTIEALLYPESSEAKKITQERRSSYVKKTNSNSIGLKSVSGFVKSVGGSIGVEHDKRKNTVSMCLDMSLYPYQVKSAKDNAPSTETVASSKATAEAAQLIKPIAETTTSKPSSANGSETKFPIPVKKTSAGVAVKNITVALLDDVNLQRKLAEKVVKNVLDFVAILSAPFYKLTYTLTLFANGKVYEEALESEACRSFDLVISDLNMPVHSHTVGDKEVEAGEYVALLSKRRGSYTIIHTASEESYERYRESPGVDDIVSKPSLELRYDPIKDAIAKFFDIKLPPYTVIAEYIRKENVRKSREQALSQASHEHKCAFERYSEAQGTDRFSDAFAELIAAAEKLSSATLLLKSAHDEVQSIIRRVRAERELQDSTFTTTAASFSMFSQPGEGGSATGGTTTSSSVAAVAANRGNSSSEGTAIDSCSSAAATSARSQFPTYLNR